MAEIELHIMTSNSERPLAVTDLLKIKIKQFFLLTTTPGSFSSLCFGFFEHMLEVCEGLTTFTGKELLLDLAAFIDFIGVHV